MKTQFLILGTIVIMASCNTQPKADVNRPSDSTRFSADTTGMAAFNAWKAQNELVTQNNKEQQEKSSPKVVSSTKHNSNTTTTSTNNSNSSSGTARKKGWSKTAKGAVIGGVVGAGTGAVISKKHRAAGAVIGGVIGAGTGAVIGNEMDKKDRKH